VLVDGSIEITPFAADFDIGFIDADRAQWGRRNCRSRFSICGA
jgi:hypothetical protein